MGNMTVETDLIIFLSVCLEGHMVIWNVNFGTHILSVCLFSKILSQSPLFFSWWNFAIFATKKLGKFRKQSFHFPNTYM